MLQALSNLDRDTSRGGTVTASLGNPCHCFAILTGKTFSLISNLNLLPLGVKSSPLVLPLHVLVKQSLPPSCCSLCSIVRLQLDHCEVSFFQTEQFKFSQPFLHSSNHLGGLLWIHSNKFMSFLCWGPLLHRRWGSHLSRAESLFLY